MLTPIVYSGYNINPFRPVLNYIYDSSINGYRALTPSDFAGGGGGGGGDASAANQTTQIGQLNQILAQLNSGINVSGVSLGHIDVNTNDLEAIGSGISGLLSNIYTVENQIYTSTNSIYGVLNSNIYGLLNAQYPIINSINTVVSGQIASLVSNINNNVGTISAIIPNINTSLIGISGLTNLEYQTLNTIYTNVADIDSVVNLIDSDIQILNSLLSAGIQISGKRVPITNLPSGASGTSASLMFNQNNGAALVQTQNRDYTADSVTTYTNKVSGISNGTIGNGLALSVNTARSLVFVQNLDTAPLYISLNGSPAAPNQYSFVLAGGYATGDGNGGVWTSDKWIGAVYTSGSPSGLFKAWEA